MLAKKVFYGLVVVSVIAALSVGGFVLAWAARRAARGCDREQQAAAALQWSASAKRRASPTLRA